MTRPRLRIGVLPRLVAGLVPLLAAVILLSLLSLDASEDAIGASQRIESEFTEDARVDLALREAHDNVAVVSERLWTRDSRRAPSLDRELRLSNLSLDTALESAVSKDGNGRRGAEVGAAALAQASFAAYRDARDGILRDVATRRTPMTPREQRDLARAFAAFRDDLADFATVHHREARGVLAEGRANEVAFKRALLVAFSFAAVSLALMGLMARRLTIRLRDKSSFAARVATGDLTARLRPGGRDELAALGWSLNAMVEQLAAAARERRELADADRAFHAAREALSEALQASESEHEAHELLKRHIERAVPQSSVTVLDRDDSDDRLVATTPIEVGSPLGEALQDARPTSCLGVRLGRVHVSTDDSTLLSCDLCGATPEASTCAPLLVSGEVIGSVLVEHVEPLAPTAERAVQDAVGQAAPTLANLRNLALAEARAATDALTGLPNRRSMDDVLKRMLAQADRLRSPFAALMLDLDHFKSINDTHGHEQGDAVLAGVADVLRSKLRGGDFVARTGGEEFVVLLPATGREGASVVAEGIRAAIAARTFVGMREGVTASLGVAVYPSAAADPETLLRLADRALYAAKGGGRNRVEIAAAVDAHVSGGDAGAVGGWAPASGAPRAAAATG